MHMHAAVERATPWRGTRTSCSLRPLRTLCHVLMPAVTPSAAGLHRQCPWTPGQAALCPSSLVVPCKPVGHNAPEWCHAERRTRAQTMPLARDQSGVLSVPFKPLTPLHKTLTDVNLAALAASAGVRKVRCVRWGCTASALCSMRGSQGRLQALCSAKISGPAACLCLQSLACLSLHP